MDVNVVIFNRSPKSFNPDVVLCPAAAVHANPHLRVFRTAFFPLPASKLAALVRVDDLCEQLRDVGHKDGSQYPVLLAVIRQGIYHPDGSRGREF